MNKFDTRFDNSSQKMYQALLDLMTVKTFETITATDVINLAGVNRSTFYAHYEAVHDLLYDVVEKKIVDPLKRISNEERVVDDGKYSYGVFLSYLQFFYEHQEILRAFCIQGPSVWKIFTDYFADRYIFPRCMGLDSEKASLVEYTAMYKLNGVISLCCLWALHGYKETPETFLNILLNSLEDGAEEEEQLQLL